MKIRFGTSGWRGIIAKDFTFYNVKIASFAIAQHLLSKKGKSVIIGYDTRFLSDEFARTAAEVLAGYGIKSYFSITDIPTPVIAYLTVKRKTDGAINITASHNDAYYNGIKFSASSGGPALPQQTKDIEERINTFFKNPEKIKTVPFDEAIQKKLVIPFKENEYLKAVKKLVDMEIIKKKYMRVIYEPFFATGRNYFPKAIREATHCTMIHGKRDPLFGGLHPEPTGKNLEPLKHRVKISGARIGLATDGDADRFGAVDSDGTFISPDMILSIIYYYLLTERKIKGNVVRTVSTTHMLDKIANAFGYKAIETPVGFKYIGDAVVKGKAIFGGEESGGATIKGWLADKDGIFVDLMILEIISKRNKTLKALFKELTDKFGEMYSERMDFEYNGERAEKEKKLKTLVHQLEKEDNIKKINEIDGTKIIFKDNSWILFRFSGTEPKIRVYCEADNKTKLDALLAKGNKIRMEIAKE